MLRKEKFFDVDLQLFAEGDGGSEDGDGAGAGGTGAGKPASGKTGGEPPAQKPEGKVFSEEYVASLREESKNHRLKAKEYEKTVRDLLGLKPEDEIADINALLVSHKAKTLQEKEETLKKAKALMLKAAIASQEGYNAKLVEKLLDPASVQVADDGTVSYIKEGKAAGGIKEALEALATEFPEIKKQSGGTGGTGGANPPGGTNIGDIDAQIAEAQKKGDARLVIALTNQKYGITQK